MRSYQGRSDIALRKALDELVVSGDFINSAAKTGELVDRLDELESFDSSRCEEYKVNIKRRFDSEQDVYKLKRMQQNEGRLTSVVNLHGKLHTCAKSLQEPCAWPRAEDGSRTEATAASQSRPSQGGD